MCSLAGSALLNLINPLYVQSLLILEQMPCYFYVSECYPCAALALSSDKREVQSSCRLGRWQYRAQSVDTFARRPHVHLIQRLIRLESWTQVSTLEYVGEPRSPQHIPAPISCLQRQSEHLSCIDRTSSESQRSIHDPNPSPQLWYWSHSSALSMRLSRVAWKLLRCWRAASNFFFGFEQAPVLPAWVYLSWSDDGSCFAKALVCIAKDHPGIAKKKTS